MSVVPNVLIVQNNPVEIYTDHDLCLLKKLTILEAAQANALLESSRVVGDIALLALERNSHVQD